MAVSTVLYGVWNAFLRYQAYGVISGRVIRVSAPWDGVLQTLHVREGDLVRQGQLLATLENLDARETLARRLGDLQIAQASVNAEVAKLRWQAQIHGDRSQKALAEYYELWGELLQEQSKLSNLESQLERTLALNRRGAIPQERMEAAQFAEQGQRDKVQKLTVAVEELRKRAELNDGSVEGDWDQLKPQLLRVEALQDEISRLQDHMTQGNVLSPVDGRLVKRHVFAGEYTRASQPLFEVLEDGSVEAVLYLSQEDAGRLKVGSEIGLVIEPLPREIVHTVVRVGDRLEPPPANLQRYYRRDQRLVPVYARPLKSPFGSLALRLGSEVKLAHHWPSLADIRDRCFRQANGVRKPPTFAVDGDDDMGASGAPDDTLGENRTGHLESNPTRGVPAP